MKVQFNSIKSAKQSIKILFEIVSPSNSDKNLSNFFYNKEAIFKYRFAIVQSKIFFKIIFDNTVSCPFHNQLIGAFVYDNSIKFNASNIEIVCNNKELSNHIYIGFKQKDFSYSIYKKNSQIEKFKSSFKVNFRFKHRLNSINFLKELVSEPSNIIYPESFVSRTKKKINKKNVGIKTLDQSKIKRLGLNCVLAVNQGSSRKPMVMSSIKNKILKMLIFYLLVKVFALIVVAFLSNQVQEWKK